MKLVEHDWACIGKFDWILKRVGNDVYYHLARPTDVILFWNRFIRNVFAPLFKQQKTLTVLHDIDPTSEVLITLQGELLLPGELESVVYYARNQTLPVGWRLGITTMFVSVTAIILILFRILLSFIITKRAITFNKSINSKSNI